jgi:hypothetical protein
VTILSCVEQDLEGAKEYEKSLTDWVTAKRLFLVQSSIYNDTEENVLSSSVALGLPAGLDYYPGSSVSRAHKFRVSRSKKDTRHWYVTVEYKTIFSKQEIDRNNFADPTARPTITTGQSRTIMVPVRRVARTPWYQGNYPGTGSSSSSSGATAYNLQTPSNSAGDPYDPPLEVAMTEWELHSVKNVSTFPSWFAGSSGYANGVNNADQLVTLQAAISSSSSSSSSSIAAVTFTLAKGTAKLSNLVFSAPRNENNINYIEIAWNTTIRLPVYGAPPPWEIEILDMGMRTRQTIGSSSSSSSSSTSPKGVWKGIRDANGQYISTAIPFNGAGDQLADVGAAIPDSSLWKSAYRPFGTPVDFSVMPWT